MRAPRALATATTLVVAVAGLRSAAAWTAVGAGAAAVGASRAPAAPAPTASPTVGGAVVSWTTITGATGYRVRRFDASGSPALPAGACATAASSPCLDSPAPAGTWTYGVRGVMASWTGSEGPTGAPVVVPVNDVAPPAIAAVGIVRSGGGAEGAIRPGATYYVYADAADPSGVGTVRADLSAISTGATAVALSSGSWVVEGIAYGWRSGALVAVSSLPDGATPGYTVTAIDRVGNAGQRSSTVRIDAVAPTPVDVQTVSAGTVGRADAGDRVVLTFSESLDPASIVGGWSGKGTASAVVRITDGGTGNDVLTVWNSSNTVQTGLGSVDLGRSDYVSGNATFGAGGAVSSIGLAGAVVTVTLGTSNTSSRTIAGTSGATMSWTPAATTTDRAGNACVTTVTAESGATDREF